MPDGSPLTRVAFVGKKIRLELRAVPGRDSTPREREIVVHPGAVVILPILPDGRVLMIRNHRPAAGKILLELPAGTRDPGEPPDVTAARELTEETGYRAGTLTPIGSFYSSPGVMTEKLHVYLAENLVEDEAALEDDEDITLAPLTMDDLLAAIDDGTLEDGKSIAALLLHQRHAQRLTRAGG